MKEVREDQESKCFFSVTGLDVRPLLAESERAEESKVISTVHPLHSFLPTWHFGFNFFI